jgi:DNA-binding protein YbaB
MAKFGDEQMEAALQALVRTDEVAMRILEQSAKISQQTSDRNKILTVTVGGRGELREISFRGDAYRELAPAELADLLVKTIEDARLAAHERALDGIQELMHWVPPPSGDLTDVGMADEFAQELLDTFIRNMPDSGHTPTRPDEKGRWL